MRWFLFFIAMLLFSCNTNDTATNKKAAIDSILVLQKDVNTYIDSFPVELVYEDDTGYFKNIGQKRIDSLEEKKERRLFRFIENNLSKKKIILLNKYGLSHSCRISPDSIYRTDTLRYGKTSII